MKQFSPLVSIITVTYNAEKYIERTIQSIIQQTYPHIEFIIIDGKSSDQTLSIIQKYRSYIAKFVSEKDNGIYDAMNKGLDLATGDFVWFMNAGDELYAPETLAKILQTSSVADIYYGETIFLDLERNYLGLRSEVTPLKLPSKLDWKDLQMGLMVCHQAILVKRSIAPYYLLNHLYSADIDWVIRSLKKASVIQNTHQIIAVYLQGGFSKRYLWNSLWDRFRILQKHYGFWKNIWNHLRIVWRGVQYVWKHKKGY